MLDKLRAFFSPASIKDHISTTELWRSIYLALGSGTALGVLIAVLQSILDHANQIFSPTAVGAVTIALTMILDSLRRSADGVPIEHLRVGQRVPVGGAVTPDPEPEVVATLPKGK